MDKLIIDELTEVRELLASPRRTQLIDAVQPNDDETEEKAAVEPAFVMFLPDNKLRRLSPKLAAADFNGRRFAPVHVAWCMLNAAR